MKRKILKIYAEPAYTEGPVPMVKVHQGTCPHGAFWSGKQKTVATQRFSSWSIGGSNGNICSGEIAKTIEITRERRVPAIPFEIRG